MFFTPVLISVASIATAVFGATCNHDNCYRALARYQTTSSSKFCSEYLATPTKHAPSSIATCGPSRLSSACSCLTSLTVTTTPTTSTLSTSTCVRSSINACPTPYDPCCAYSCAEAQVPFQVCSQNNETVLALCSKCPGGPTAMPGA